MPQRDLMVFVQVKRSQFSAAAALTYLVRGFRRTGQAVDA